MAPEVPGAPSGWWRLAFIWESRGLTIAIIVVCFWCEVEQVFVPFFFLNFYLYFLIGKSGGTLRSFPELLRLILRFIFGGQELERSLLAKFYLLTINSVVSMVTVLDIFNPHISSNNLTQIIKWGSLILNIVFFNLWLHLYPASLQHLSCSTQCCWPICHFLGVPGSWLGHFWLLGL